MTDRYQWVRAHVLDASIATALDGENPHRAEPLVADPTALVARCDLQELLVRARLHEFRLGDQGALKSARRLGADVDNPALSSILRAAGPETA